MVVLRMFMKPSASVFGRVSDNESLLSSLTLSLQSCHLSYPLVSLILSCLFSMALSSLLLSSLIFSYPLFYQVTDEDLQIAEMIKGAPRIKQEIAKVR